MEPKPKGFGRARARAAARAPLVSYVLRFTGELGLARQPLALCWFGSPAGPSSCQNSGQSRRESLRRSRATVLYVRAYDVSTADGRRLRNVLGSLLPVSEQKRRVDVVGVAARSEPNWSKGSAAPSGLLVIASELASSVFVHELPIVDGEGRAEAGQVGARSGEFEAGVAVRIFQSRIRHMENLDRI